MRRRTWLLGLMAAALITGCGSEAPSGTGGLSATTERALRFAACMRHNGVANFPDPGSSGNFTIDQIANGTSLKTTTPAFTQALSDCRSLEPAGFTGTKRTAGQQSVALRFAACMRKNGVPDFPDPVNGQPLIDTYQIPSSSQPGGMAALNAASRSCRTLLDAALRGQ